ncbi:hypothetical protein niasHT_008720 [Heterodera trifolii]|uniref:C-factor n=1 Tax=Heterodera trifolii TaxID=157864 RepID=A0ABD2M260_9BILA
MTTAAFLPLLKKAASAGEFARVVNIGSSLGCIGQAAVSPRLSPYQNVAYGMSKAALHHFSKMMALDESDIVTVAIHPGWVKTEMGGANATMSVSDSVAKIWRGFAHSQRATRENCYTEKRNCCREEKSCHSSQFAFCRL